MFLKGNIAYTPTPEKFKIIPKGYVEIINGYIENIHTQRPEGIKDEEIVDHGDALLIPGFVDLHLHAPQFANVGLGLDMELLPWLNTYTFPEEAKYSSSEYAQEIYAQFVEALWRNGTTRSVIFASIHKDATRKLMEMLIQAGLGAYVGKVNMDRNAPDYLREDTEKSLKDTEELIQEFQNKSDLVKPIITPRFVPTCTSELMRGLGDLAEKYKVKIQSHLSENLGEIEWVKELHPETSTYGHVYDEFGLFGQQPTLMAHCIHCPKEEIALLKERGVYAVHCPHSNANLGSGIMPVREMLNQGIKIGLGSDISGGHKFFMPNNLTTAIEFSRLIWGGSNKETDALMTSEAFYLATKGGGEFFGKVGSLEPGYEADVLVIDDDNLGVRGLTLEERLQRFLYLGDDRNIKSRYVKGCLLAEPKF